MKCFVSVMENAFILFWNWVLRKHVILFMFYTYVFLLISLCLAECKSLQTTVWILMKFDIGRFYKRKVSDHPNFA
jgi:hypothetical protein